MHGRQCFALRMSPGAPLVPTEAPRHGSVQPGLLPQGGIAPTATGQPLRCNSCDCKTSDIDAAQFVLASRPCARMAHTTLIHSSGTALPLSLLLHLTPSAGSPVALLSQETHQRPRASSRTSADVHKASPHAEHLYSTVRQGHATPSTGSNNQQNRPQAALPPAMRPARSQLPAPSAKPRCIKQRHLHTRKHTRKATHPPEAF